MNTDEVLIQKTIELCKNNVTRLEKTIAEQQVEDYPWRCEVTFYGTELNSWKTHLAEFEEHHSEMLPSGSFNYAGNPLYSEQCDKCQNGEMYPCREALIKAKRLLGVE